MNKQTWTIAGVLTAALVVFTLLLAFNARNRELAHQKAQLVEASRAFELVRAALTRAEGEIAELKERLTQGESRLSELQEEKEVAVKSHHTLEDEMRSALESKDVTISQLQGKLTVSILDRVLFDSGEAQLKPDGEAVLQKVGAFLVQHPTLKVHVIGHTDNVPIRSAARSRFPSNWELSTARANAAVRFLSEQGGVDPHRLGAVGYGEFRPIADNATPEGRARNRRIAITVLPDELAGADTSATAVTNLPPRLLSRPTAVVPATPPVTPPVESTSPPND